MRGQLPSRPLLKLNEPLFHFKNGGNRNVFVISISCQLLKVANYFTTCQRQTYKLSRLLISVTAQVNIFKKLPQVEELNGPNSA